MTAWIIGPLFPPSPIFKIRRAAYLESTGRPCP